MSRVQEQVWLFVYGSLQPGERNYGAVAGWVQEAVPGIVRGRLVDAANGAYPALVRVPRECEIGLADSQTLGWWLRIDREGLESADRLEEFSGGEELNDYERIWTVDLQDSNRAGWIYVWPNDRGCPYLHSSKWPLR
ncbi:Uncharacterized conserved protein YtfP, gamma-glutamylcyclotransferase (GGCT)/AIG2-like family [Paenibacillaceae bacterium GAS479]|nr:Uncharacterized conserved protein YtfP, gamma-glutamylcyclotransferase (GGCT)/AIG2-like family [Paenibacillaceae bacterium GAS479]